MQEASVGTFVPRAARRRDPEAVKRYLSAKLEAMLPPSSSPRFRMSEQTIRVRECPSPSFCKRTDSYENRLRGDNSYTFHVFKDTGSYHCFRCGAKGNLLKFKQLAGNFTTVSAAEVRPEIQSKAPVRRAPTNMAEVSKFPLDLLRTSYGRRVLAYLETERGLSWETIARYGCGACERKFYHQDTATWITEPCVTFPWIHVDDDRHDDVVKRVKLRSIVTKRNMRIEPKGSDDWAFFGGGLISLLDDKKKNTHHADSSSDSDSSESSVVLTEGEYDAMAVFQGTGMLALSLPNGAASLPPATLPLLERFSRIYLWLDDDAAGHAGADRFARKLGPSRCRVVRGLSSGGAKDANDALRKGLDMREALATALPPTHAKLKTASDYRGEVVEELLNPDAFAGVPLTSLPTLRKHLKGIRPGEFTLLTGGTGTGKTTLASQISLDLVEQRAPALWGSFEVKNAKLIIKMLRQKFQRNPKKRFLAANNNVTAQLWAPLLEDAGRPLLDAMLDTFDTLPLHFMTFHGASDVDAVVDAMEFARYVHDVDVYFLDNLQFMTQVTNDLQRLAQQDMVVSKFRQFATDHDAHVFMVVHPRKENPDTRLTIQSVYGSGKATQEADNVLILNNLHRPEQQQQPHYGQQGQKNNQSAFDQYFKSLDVAKNRQAGELGTVNLKFDTDSHRYFEIGTNYSASTTTTSSSSSKQKKKDDDSKDHA